jgi:hypothetical protein
MTSRPHYHVEKSPHHARGWTVRRLDQPAHSGRVNSRKEALGIARILAGWNGIVTQGKTP